MRGLMQELSSRECAVLVAAGLPVRAAEPTAVGLWEHTDENTGKPGSWFKIIEKNGVYEGGDGQDLLQARRRRELGLQQVRRRGARAPRCSAWP